MATFLNVNLLQKLILLSVISIWTHSLTTTSDRTTDRTGTLDVWDHSTTETTKPTPVTETNVTQLSIALDNFTFSTDLEFLSVALGTGVLNRTWRLNKIIKTSDGQKLVNLGRGLTPSTLRIGGSFADFCIFDNEVDPKPPISNVSQKVDTRQFYLTASTWDALSSVVGEMGWDLMYNLNILLWQDQDKTKWDPTNARAFLNYSDSKGIDIPLFQLGNEVSSYAHRYDISMSAEDLVDHFRALRRLLGEFPRYKNSCIVGPDVITLSRHPSARKFVNKFMDAGGGDVVCAIGQHHYYLNGDTSTIKHFYNRTVMADMQTATDHLRDLVWTVKPHLPLWLTETSSTNDGGLPGASNRFAGGFLWLDKLGMAAREGISKVVRQTFFGSSYALIDYHLFPFPDYYLSVLFKRLVLGPVFNVTLDPLNIDLRVYAQCARTDFYNYPKGAVVVYYLNLANTTHTLNMTDFAHLDVLLFQLTAPDFDLSSKYVNLNDRKLELLNDSLPSLEPATHRGPVDLPPLSFGFVVVPGAQIPLCGYTETTGTTPTGRPITTKGHWGSNGVASALRSHFGKMCWNILIGLMFIIISI